MISPSSNLTDIAFAVCTALDGVGFTAVLTGGSAATFYSAEAYLSDDLDFVLTLLGKHGEEALKALGYQRKGDLYRHARSRFTLEFPPGPLAIGEDLVESWSTVRRKGELLHVLSPTDSCRDRLASYLFWNDFRGLEQALLVLQAQRRRVDLKAVAAWCKREGHEQKYGLFERRAKSPRSKGR